MPNCRSSSRNRSQSRRRSRSISHDYNLRSECDGIRCDTAISLSPTNSYSSIRVRHRSTPIRTPRRRSVSLRRARRRSAPLRTPSSHSDSFTPRSRSVPIQRRSVPIRRHSRNTSRSQSSSSSRTYSDSRSSTGSSQSRSSSHSVSSETASSTASYASNGYHRLSRPRDRLPKAFQQSRVSILSSNTTPGSIPRARSLSSTPGVVPPSSPFLTAHSGSVSPAISCTPDFAADGPMASFQLPTTPNNQQNLDRSWSIFGKNSTPSQQERNDPPVLLMVDKQLKSKMSCVFYFEGEQMIVDSQMIIMPMNFTEAELRQEVEEMKAKDGKVFLEAFTDGEDVMEIMEMSVLTGRRCIFIRRQSRLTQAGKTVAFHYHPIHAMCRARLNGHETLLHVESIYNSARSGDAVSRKEAIVLTFSGLGHAVANSQDLQRRMKEQPWVLPPREHESIYILESANCVGGTLVLERDMHLKKTLWQHQGTDYRKEYNGTHLLQVDGSTPVRPGAPITPPRPHQKTPSKPQQQKTPPPKLQQQKTPPPKLQQQKTPPPKLQQLKTPPPKLQQQPTKSPRQIKPRVSDTVSVSPPQATLDDARHQTFRTAARTPPAVNGRPSVIRKLFDTTSTKSAVKKTSEKSSEKKKKVQIHQATPMPKTQQQLKKTAAASPVEHVVLVPHDRLTINGPFNLASVHQVLVKNVGSRHVAWCMKTNSLVRFVFQPTNGIIRPGQETRVTVHFNGLSEQETVPEKDRLEVRYVLVEPGTKFSHDLFQATDTIRVTKSLTIGYNK